MYICHTYQISKNNPFFAFVILAFSFWTGGLFTAMFCIVFFFAIRSFHTPVYMYSYIYRKNVTRLERDQFTTCFENVLSKSLYLAHSWLFVHKGTNFASKSISTRKVFFLSPQNNLNENREVKNYSAELKKKVHIKLDCPLFCSHTKSIEADIVCWYLFFFYFFFLM